MPPVKMISKPPLDQAIAEKGEALLALLDQVLPEERGEAMGTILWGIKEFLPSLVSAMSRGVYRENGQIPEMYYPATLLPAGWSTVMLITLAGVLRTHQEAPDKATRDFNRGTRWAYEKIRREFQPKGADTGEEPLNFHIARKSLELASLVNQVEHETNDTPGGAALFLCRQTLPSLARIMNEGLNNYFALIPMVDNPGYLPPDDWVARIATLRADPAATGDDPAKYHYYEGVRWMFSHLRDTFRHLTEVSPFLQRAA